ncbi:hypothetical protein ACHQM5_006994 [Ranunculus cassubicifolius]
MNKEVDEVNKRDKEKYIKWEPPAEGEWKINSDGAAAGNPVPGGASCIIRDSNGNMKVASNIPLMNTNSYEAEIQGLKLGLVLAQKMELKKVRCQVDCRSLMESIRKTRTERMDTYQEDQLMEIQKMMKELEILDIEWKPRETNAVSDQLAKEATTTAKLIWQGQHQQTFTHNVSFSLPMYDNINIWTTVPNSVGISFKNDQNGVMYLRT